MGTRRAPRVTATAKARKMTTASTSKTNTTTILAPRGPRVRATAAVQVEATSKRRGQATAAKMTMTWRPPASAMLLTLTPHSLLASLMNLTFTSRCLAPPVLALCARLAVLVLALCPCLVRTSCCACACAAASAVCLCCFPCLLQSAMTHTRTRAVLLLCRHVQTDGEPGVVCCQPHHAAPPAPRRSYVQLI